MLREAGDSTKPRSDESFYNSIPWNLYFYNLGRCSRIGGPGARQVALAADPGTGERAGDVGPLRGGLERGPGGLVCANGDRDIFLC